MRTSASPPLLALLALDRSAAAPLHRQIYQGIRSAILEGRLRPGQRVPATRVLAGELVVSRLPVLAAYEQLLHEGYLTGRVGSGTFVSDTLPDDALEAPAAARAVSFGPAASLAPAGGTLHPFRMSLPALDDFPHAAWARIVSRKVRTLGVEQMAYGAPAGVSELRAAVAEHLRTHRGVRCEAHQVLIVPGSQTALRLAAGVLLDPGDRVAVEEPGYPGARAALSAAGARLVPVPVDAEGIDPHRLERDRTGIRAVCVTPSHQYPLGGSLPVSRRLALLDWARRHDAWILEDDYDSEYRYVSRPLGALQGMDQHERVAYIGTFSKVMFPALRVGYLVVPPPLIDRFIAAREAFDLFSPTLYQLALAEFLTEGHFVRHLRRMRGTYLRRRNALLAGLAGHCAGTLRVLNADAGLHVATMLTNAGDDVEVVRQLERRGLTATPLSSCYATRHWQSGLLLGFGGFPEERLGEAAIVLGQVLGRQRG